MPDLEIGDVLGIPDPPPIADGVHEAIIEDIEVQKDNTFFRDKNNEPYVKAHFTIDDPSDQGFNKRRISDYYISVKPESMRWKNLVLSSDSQSTNIKNTAELKGARVLLQTKMELYNGDMRAGVVGYIRRKR